MKGMNGFERRTDDDLDPLVKKYIREHCGELLGGYGSLLDMPGGLEFIGAMIRSDENVTRRR